MNRVTTIDQLAEFGKSLREKVAKPDPPGKATKPHAKDAMLAAYPSGKRRPSWFGKAV